VESTDERWFEAKLHRLRGEVLLRLVNLLKMQTCLFRACISASQEELQTSDLSPTR
jgi:hypothetical protein